MADLSYMQVSELPRYKQLSVVDAKSVVEPVSTAVGAPPSILGVSIPPVRPASKGGVEVTAPPAKRSAQSPSDNGRDGKRGRTGGATAEEEGAVVYDGDSEGADTDMDDGDEGGEYEAEVTGGDAEEVTEEMAPEEGAMVRTLTELLMHYISYTNKCILFSPVQNEVVFLHRRVRFVSTGGLEIFKMEPTGTPIVEVLPEKLRAQDLYAAVSSRVKHLLKSPVSAEPFHMPHVTLFGLTVVADIGADEKHGSEPTHTLWLGTAGARAGQWRWQQQSEPGRDGGGGWQRGSLAHTTRGYGGRYRCGSASRRLRTQVRVAITLIFTIVINHLFLILIHSQASFAKWRFLWKVIADHWLYHVR
jgi:hypothetical protein